MVPTKLAHSLPITDAARRRGLEREDLHVRNRDTTTTYDVEVTVRQAGERCHRGAYRLRPGQAGSSVTLLSPGEYTVTASIPDGLDTAAVTVSDAAEETIFVEIRDGQVTVTEGVR